MIERPNHEENHISGWIPPHSRYCWEYRLKECAFVYPPENQHGHAHHIAIKQNRFFQFLGKTLLNIGY